MTDIKTSVLYVSGKPALVTLDYLIDASSIYGKNEEINYDQVTYVLFYNRPTKIHRCTFSEFRLSYYPHRLEVFKNMLVEAFGERSKFDLYGDFKDLEEIENPAFYIHVVEKARRMV